MGIMAELLKVWISEATREKDPEPRRRDKLVSVTKPAFRERRIPTALIWTAMVLIPKVGEYFRGISLVEVIWKVCASIINNKLWAAITLHYALHGFRQGRGTRTATTDINLSQEIAALCHEPLFQVLLDVQKSYNYLDRGRLMEILRGYVLGPNLQRILHQYWDDQAVVLKAGKLF